MEHQNKIVGKYSSDQREGDLIGDVDIRSVTRGVPEGTFVELVLRWED